MSDKLTEPQMRLLAQMAEKSEVGVYVWNPKSGVAGRLISRGLAEQRKGWTGIDGQYIWITDAGRKVLETARGASR